MEEASQLYVFFSCILCGVASGVVYDVLYLVKQFVKVKTVSLSLDVLFFIVFAGIYVFVSVMFALPAFRPYMFFGCLAGLLLYLKSIHRILAFFVKTLYNIKNK